MHISVRFLILPDFAYFMFNQFSLIDFQVHAELCISDEMEIWWMYQWMANIKNLEGSTSTFA